jgi:integrase
VYNHFKDGFTEASVRVDDGSTALRPHWTRHTALTYLLNARERVEGYEDWSKERLQQYAGHKSIAVTEGYATFVDREFFDGLADAFGWDV